MVNYMVKQSKNFNPKYKWARARYQPCLPLGENGQKVSASKEHIKLARTAAEEGMVLLKNENNVLPLAKGEKIALFGKGSVDTVIGGWGSGNVTTSPYAVTIFEGLKNKEDSGRIQLFKDNYDHIKKYTDKLNAKTVRPGLRDYDDTKCPESILKKASSFADTAIFVLSRDAGESIDRNGDFDMLPGERALFEQVEANFNKIILLLNICGPVNLKEFKDNKKVGAILACFASGIEGGNACADILCGDVNPSGRLTDTYADDLDAYPSTETFTASPDYVEYKEDIFVGYRYFETFDFAKNHVVYPFGYGLSYTEYDIKFLNGYLKNKKIFVECEVKNIGSVSGKETVQLYYSAPQGKLGKASRELCAFQKTNELAPGKSQKIILSFSVDDMSSYDDMGKVQKSAWILEKGTYSFYLGNNVRNAEKIDFSYKVDKSFEMVEQLCERCKPSSAFSRLTAFGEYEDVDFEECRQYPSEKSPATKLKPMKYDEKYKLIDVATGKVKVEKFLSQLSDEELIHLTGASTYNPNKGVANTFGIGNLEEYGIPNIMTADGPAGVRLNEETMAPATFWPMSTVLANTWNPKIVNRVGEAAGKEVKENNLDIWLAPGMNIHRTPMCGRNFEYYSEDPFLTGTMATAMVKGIQSVGVSACIKHFCCNNKEDFRTESDSRVSERALREIYLKGFEMTVKNAKPWMLMTAYNKMNGIFTSTNKELLTDILRNEWGFDGCVSSDWGNHAPHVLEIKAGNNFKMPYGFPDSVMEAIHNFDINREEIMECAKHVVEMILRVGD